MKKVINARMIVKPEFVEQFILCAKKMVEFSNSEPGCLIYKLYQEIGCKTSFIIYEEYKNQEAVDFHRSSEYLKNFHKETSEMLVEKIVEMY